MAVDSIHHTPTKSQPTLTIALPLELLVEIIVELDWLDVLHIRETCKTLCIVSKERAVWLSLFRKYSTVNNSRLLWIEKPIENYASSELEFLVLRWRRAQIGWRATKDSGLARERLLQSETHIIDMRLVPGGRWLITSHVNFLCYWDLDAENTAPTILLPTEGGRDNYHFLKGMTLDIGMYTETLSLSTFNIALHAFRLNPLGPKPEAIVQVWRISVVLNDQCLDIGLSATCISSFRLPDAESGLPESSLSLFGATLAYTMYMKSHHAGLCTVVVDWAKAGRSADYPSQIFDSFANTQCLLPNDRVLIGGDFNYGLYDYSNAPRVKINPKGFYFLDQEHHWDIAIKDSYPSLDIHPVLLSAEAAHMIISTEQCVYSLMVSDDLALGASPHIIKLRDRGSDSRCHLSLFGRHYGIEFDNENRSLRRYQRSANEDEEPFSFCGASTLSYSSHHNHISSMAMDEGSGRVLLSSITRLTMLDFALVTSILYSD